MRTSPSNPLPPHLQASFLKVTSQGRGKHEKLLPYLYESSRDMQRLGQRPSGLFGAPAIEQQVVCYVHTCRHAGEQCVSGPGLRQARSKK